jgi:hypothetical protein
VKRLALALVVVGVLLSPGAIYAQELKQPSPLTEVEKLKLERAVLLQRIDGLTKEVAQWRQLFAQASSRLGEFEAAVQQEQTKTYQESVIKDIESARPGFTFNPQDGTFKPKQEK